MDETTNETAVAIAEPMPTQHPDTARAGRRLNEANERLRMAELALVMAQHENEMAADEQAKFDAEDMRARAMGQEWVKQRVTADAAYTRGSGSGRHVANHAGVPAAVMADLEAAVKAARRDVAKAQQHVDDAKQLPPYDAAQAARDAGERFVAERNITLGGVWYPRGAPVPQAVLNRLPWAKFDALRRAGQLREVD